MCTVFVRVVLCLPTKLLTERYKPGLFADTGLHSTYCNAIIIVVHTS